MLFPLLPTVNQSFSPQHLHTLLCNVLEDKAQSAVFSYMLKKEGKKREEYGINEETPVGVLENAFFV